MKRNLRLLGAVGVVAMAVALTAALAACGGGEKKTAAPTSTVASEEPTATEAAAITPEPSEQMTTVAISLNEWTITAPGGGAIANVPAGEVSFDVHNDGKIAHEMVVIKTDTDPAQLPKSDGDVDEEAAGQVIGEVEQFAAGGTETGTFNLQPGTYALICNIAGHYTSGMQAQLIVE